MSRYLLRIPTHLSLSKKSGWSWALSDRYSRMDKGDKRCRFATQRNGAIISRQTKPLFNFKIKIAVTAPPIRNAPCFAL